MSHLQKLLAAAGFEGFAVEFGEFTEGRFDVIADDVDGAFGFAVGAAHGFFDDGVDDGELFQVLRRQFQGARGVLGEFGGAPEDRGTAFGRNHGIDGMLQHHHAVGGGDGDRAARAAFADDDRYQRHGGAQAAFD